MEQPQEPSHEADETHPLQPSDEIEDTPIEDTHIGEIPVGEIPFEETPEDEGEMQDEVLPPEGTSEAASEGISGTAPEIAPSALEASSYADLVRNLAAEENVEQKIALALDFMASTLAQQGTPHFKEFWDVRRQCLALFKEAANSTLRTHLWGRYCDLSREARRLKEILDEQTAFAMEQIEVAIKALETELLNEEEALTRAPVTLSADVIPSTLEPNQVEFYQNLQRRLSLLNAQAARIDGLRDGLIKTEMRVRHKNKFFERLSTAGDRVFPQRKELIRQSSTQFIADVDQFVALYFPENEPQEDLYALREEIKVWQSFAKRLTLNSHAFTYSRRALSHCWDLLKDREKERKKSRSQQRAHHKQNAEAIAAELTALRQKVESKELPIIELDRELSHLNDHIRKTDLEREDVRSLRSALDAIHRSIEAQEKALQQARDQEEKLRQQARHEKVHQFKESVQDLSARVDSADADLEQLTVEYQQLIASTEAAGFSRQEKQQLERTFRDLRDAIAAQKDRRLFALAGGQGEEGIDKRAIQADCNRLREHRRELDEQLKSLKKQSESSGLDFAKAIELNDQIQVIKERLEKADVAIRDLTHKLR